MNIKDNLKYLLILLIVSFLFYLVYKNYKENKTLEEFMQRNSMSSYYQSNDDSDFMNNPDYMKHDLNYTDNTITIKKSLWNGTWEFDDVSGKKYCITFLQVNRDLLFVINKKTYNISEPDPDPYLTEEEDNTPQCLPGMAICKGELNDQGNICFLKNVYCSNNKDGNGKFPIDGTDIDDDLINRLSLNLGLKDGSVDEYELKLNIYDDTNDTTNTIPCTKDTSVDFKYGASAEYLLRTSYNVPMPNVKNKLVVDPDICKNSSFGSYNRGDLKKCYIKNGGLPTPEDKTTNNITQWNDYGTGCYPISDEEQEEEGYDACPINNEKTCFIPLMNNETPSKPLDNVSEYRKCNIQYDMNITNQTSLSKPFYNKSSSQNLLGLCENIQGFDNSKYNSAIIMYIDNLSNVETLDFEFFGIKDGQNYLTTKLDMMFPFMNQYVLNTYRKNISDNSDTEDALRLTNCTEINKSGTTNFNTLLNDCTNTYKSVSTDYDKLINKINNTKKNTSEDKLKTMNTIMKKIDNGINEESQKKLIQPTVWSIDVEQNDYTNDCSFILGTSNKYRKESRFVKYAEFDSRKNKTKLNLHKGGNKQKLVLENSHIIDFNTSPTSPLGADNISDDYILLSGNLRTYHPKKYLIPGQGNKLTNFGKEVYLQPEVKPSGKWVILGFNLTKDLDYGLSSNSYNNTLINTLKAIKAKMTDTSIP